MKQLFILALTICIFDIFLFVSLRSSSMLYCGLALHIIKISKDYITLKQKLWCSYEMKFASTTIPCCLRSRPNLSLFHSLFQNATSPALVIFRQILQANVNPNEFTFSLLIKAYLSSPSFTHCPSTAALQARQIQTQCLKRGVNQFIHVHTSLIDLYMKLGFTSHARNLFDQMSYRDVVSWNLLICGWLFTIMLFNSL